MMVYEGFKDILEIQKFRRFVGCYVFYYFIFSNNNTRIGYSREDQYCAAYLAGTELLGDSDKLYKAALGNCFKAEEWGPIEFCIMSKHFERQGKAPYAYHAKYLAPAVIASDLKGFGQQLIAKCCKSFDIGNEESMSREVDEQSKPD
ncbi:hypothetical protein ACJRO7_012128 [Eucalyptus globulus]|uniref:Uncharacterized protein n=1 Tax=Eucalyptus globulus TaxID=34317 RepID=A0ABD3LIG2_EUCGL